MTDNNIHETNRNTKTARATQKTGCRVTKRQPRDSRNCSNGRGIAQFRSSLEGCIQKRWATSTNQQTTSRKAMQAVPKAAFKASSASLERPQSKRLQDRLVDTAEDRSANTKAFWPIVSTFRRLVCSFSYGLELPKTREEGQRTQRAGHSRLAKEGLASYKKKPIKPAEPPYWPMKAALCCNRPLGEHGHLRDKRPFNIAGIEGTVSRQFPQSVFRLNDIDWVCTSLYRTVISGWRILRYLYRSFLSIFRKALSWFLTAGWFIAGQKEDCARGLPNVLSLNGFQLMPRILIRSSRSGITANTVSLPIIFLMMYWHLKKP